MAEVRAWSLLLLLNVRLVYLKWENSDKILIIFHLETEEPGHLGPSTPQRRVYNLLPSIQNERGPSKIDQTNKKIFTRRKEVIWRMMKTFVPLCSLELEGLGLLPGENFSENEEECQFYKDTILKINPHLPKCP